MIGFALMGQLSKAIVERRELLYSSLLASSGLAVTMLSRMEIWSDLLSGDLSAYRMLLLLSWLVR